MNKTKIAWGTEVSPDLAGNAYGYKTHNECLKEAIEQHPLGEINNDAEDVVIICSPDFYEKRIPGKVNWLFTMFEGDSLPLIYQRSIKKADYILTPSTWVAKLMKDYFDPKKIFVIPHGVKPIYTYVERTNPKIIPFRYLWVGAPNPRKGYEEIIGVWDRLFKNDPQLELYVKTTLKLSKKDKIHKKGNVIIDGRDIPLDEMVGLYHSANCYVFPTKGEGFGLTLAEAMATGLPCIATNYSGHTDFFDNTVGYTLEYKMTKGKTEFFRGKKDEKIHYANIAQPDVIDLAYKMLVSRIYYEESLQLGKNASKRIKKEYTWNNSAETLIRFVNKYGGLQKNKIKE